MHFPITLLLTYFACFACFVTADMITDTSHLQDVASDLAATVYASLNGTSSLDTSSYVANITSQINEAHADLLANNWTSNNANFTSNQAYLNYVDEVDNFANTVQRRGQLFHAELNLPVYQALQSLATAVHAYGFELTSKHLISRNSIIRTMTSGSTIIRAQAAWVNNQNFPGKRNAPEGRR